MKKIYNLLLLSTLLLFGASNAWANYGWYSGAMKIGGLTTDCTAWSTSGETPTDLGYLTDMTITSIAFNVWDDNNDRGGANMYFRIWDGGDSQVGDDQDLYLGTATRIAGDHDFSISWSGTKDLASAVGLTLEVGKTYYIDMWAKTYGNAGDHWYSGDNFSNYHAKFVYGITIGASGWATFSNEHEVAIPAGVTAYYASDVNSSTNVVTLTEISGGHIPANVGVVLHGNADDYELSVTSTSATLGATNYLQANTAPRNLTADVEESSTTYYHYTLAVDGENNPIFKHSSGSGVLAAGKAYLKTTVNVTTPSAPAIIRDENGATSIDTVDAVEEGVKFIQNGKLFIKKDGVVYDMVGAIVK